MFLVFNCLALDQMSSVNKLNNKPSPESPRISSLNFLGEYKPVGNAEGDICRVEVECIVMFPNGTKMRGTVHLVQVPSGTGFVFLRGDFHLAYGKGTIEPEFVLSCSSSEDVERYFVDPITLDANLEGELFRFMDDSLNRSKVALAFGSSSYGFLQPVVDVVKNLCLAVKLSECVDSGFDENDELLRQEEARGRHTTIMASESYGENEVEVSPSEMLQKLQRLLANMEDALGAGRHARVGELKGKLNGVLVEIIGIPILPGSYPFTHSQSYLLAKVGVLLFIQDTKEAYKYYMAHLKDKAWD